MTDTTVTTEAPTEALPIAPSSTKLLVPIVKGKTDIEIDTSMIPDDVYQEIVLQGLKVILNRGMSKVTLTGLTGDQLESAKAAAMAIAAKNIEAVRTSAIKFSGKSAKATKSSGAEMTEARRIARNLVKDSMKAQKLKISHYKAAEITAAANELIKADPSILDQAKANLAARATTPIKIDLGAVLKEDPALVAKAEAAAAAKKAKGAPLSAAKAGKTQTRSKPQAGANTTA